VWAAVCAVRLASRGLLWDNGCVACVSCADRTTVIDRAAFRRVVVCVRACVHSCAFECLFVFRVPTAAHTRDLLSAVSWPATNSHSMTPADVVNVNKSCRL